ncbi:exodeoxyribonuclease V alpha subunit [Weissella oryzae SG25]|uniref:ATP-dependent RecD2 DNA helicase n=1 Tax=Weissella oryzae (strain DSM 25784 / JCM 18191 / LMG 30913 / SG25) TaxID=1329250 RepID=A0A069CZX2_WEIOS|nr:ATP-dependent RecD-like DNA helicase [Weissella oryzae]GAK30646.1 exodeoxyribonuclease V alpha subunit [Weissella oryzae SG25]
MSMNEETDLFFDEDASSTEAPFIAGQVQTIMFAAQDSFYKVLRVQVTDQNIDYEEEEIVVTGSFGDIQLGAGYQFTGRVTNHARYGIQFTASNYTKQSPSTSSGLVNYLAGEHFKGIGKATASKIVDALGVEAINLILADEHVLDDLDLSSKTKASLVEQLAKTDGMERAIIALNDYGFGSALANQIYQKYQNQTLAVLKENPYQLIFDIEGVSFTRIDQLAQQQGMDPLDGRRIQAGTVAALNEVTFGAGDSYVEVDELLSAVQRLLERSQNTAINQALIERAILSLTTDGIIIAEDNRLYMQTIYNAEVAIAEKMVTLTKRKFGAFKRADVLHELKQIEEENDFAYDEAQEDAIVAALTANLFILTGGPGTGKTTIVNGIVKVYRRLLQKEGLKTDELDQAIALAAPTGRAAKRLSEATKMPASTIHRLLGITGRENNADLELESLSSRLLVVDEMSMVDTELFALLLSALPAGMQIILVGDKDQLPSVGPGRVFFDLLATGLLNYRELELIHRQAQGSTIIELASAVKSGQLPADFTAQRADRSFFRATMQTVPKLVAKVAESWRDKGNSVADMQILAPMYKSSAGVHNLNQIAQDIFNPVTPKKREIKLKYGDLSFAFRVGDKVMQTANDPEHNVFNGDIGYIASILYAKDPVNTDKVDMITVDFDAGEVTYVRQDFNQLTLAYATTIHKAQGAEFKLVILPLVNYFSRMLQRNLLYTGLTRASSSLVLIGEEAAFIRATTNEGINRKTTLQERIKQVQAGKPLLGKAESNIAKPQVAKERQAEAIEENTAEQKIVTPDLSEHYLTKVLIDAEQIDPNIGMSDLSPASFAN